VKIKYSAKTGGFYPEGIQYANLPDDLVDVDLEHYEKLLASTEGEIVADANRQPCIKSKSQADKLIEQSAYIDHYIEEKLKSLNYDNMQEVALCCTGGQYMAEAKELSLWIHECWSKQSDIINGKIICQDKECVIAALPSFNISSTI
jgi:hypothetical protein